VGLWFVAAGSKEENMLQTAVVRAQYPVSIDSDQELLESVKSGDTEAFGVLVEKYQDRIFRVAHSITHNREDAEDVSQNVFFKAFEALKNFEGRSTFSTWLTRIAVNESLMHIRRRRAVMVSLDQPSKDDDKPIQLRDPSPSPEQLCNHGEMRQLLEFALRRLQPALRIVFVLRDIEGLSVEETADVLNLTVQAIKTRLYRARRALRVRLQHLTLVPSARLATTLPGAFGRYSPTA
jgi:RNA polymerase sigma-70 factor (ECF subfamily)